MALDKRLKTGIIVKIPKSSVDTALKRITALVEGGIQLVGIDMRHSEALRVVEESNARFTDRLVILADFVPDTGSARRAILAGADVISTPYLIQEILTICMRYGKVCVPGALTPTEVLRSVESGASLVKLYPADLFGPGLLKAIKGPLPQAQIMPSSGVDSGNMAEWFRAGASAVMLDDLFEGMREGHFPPDDENLTVYAHNITKKYESTSASIQQRRES